MGRITSQKERGDISERSQCIGSSWARTGTQMEGLQRKEGEETNRSKGQQQRMMEDGRSRSSKANFGTLSLHEGKRKEEQETR